MAWLGGYFEVAPGRVPFEDRMKVRDSGMPNEEVWSGFFDAAKTLAALGFRRSKMDVVEFGCGYGTFTVAAARLTTGTVFALDMDPTMTAATRAKVSESSQSNVRVIERDFVARGTGLSDDSVHWAMLFNILHAESPVALLREARRVLRPQGVAAVIHWNYDESTPRGPDLRIRPRPEQCRDWLREAGFKADEPTISLPPYHYGLTGTKELSN